MILIYKNLVLQDNFVLPDLIELKQLIPSWHVPNERSDKDRICYSFVVFLCSPSSEESEYLPNFRFQCITFIFQAVLSVSLIAISNVTVHKIPPIKHCLVQMKFQRHSLFANLNQIIVSFLTTAASGGRNCQKNNKTNKSRCRYFKNVPAP